MANLSPCALALIAVSEDNRRLRGYWQWEMRSRAVCLIEIDRLNREIAARDAALDACAAAAYANGLAAGRVEADLRAAERQVLTLTADLATVQDDRAAADRNASTYRRDLLALQDRVVALEEQLAEAQDDARAGEVSGAGRGRAMIAQWKPVSDIYWRIDLPGGLYALVFPCIRGTYRVRGTFAPRDGAETLAEGQRWAVESLRAVVREALYELEDGPTAADVEMLNQYKPSRESVITER